MIENFILYYVLFILWKNLNNTSANFKGASKNAAIWLTMSSGLSMLSIVVFFIWFCVLYSWSALWVLPAIILSMYFTSDPNTMFGFWVGAISSFVNPAIIGILVDRLI